MNGVPVFISISFRYNSFMNSIDKLAWIRIENRKVLTTRSKGKDTYYVLGGKREPGESDHGALIREIKEEVDVDLIPETIKSFGVYEAQAHGKPEGTMVRMTCYTADYKGILKPSSEIEEVIWASYEIKKQSSPVDKIILDELKARDLID